MPEERALDLWRSPLFNGYGDSIAPVVALARVTLAVPVRDPRGSNMRHPPIRFHRRPAWVFAWYEHLSSSCCGGSIDKLPTPTPTPTPEWTGRPEGEWCRGQPIEIIAADTSGEGVTYRTGESRPCSPRAKGPSAIPATYGVFVPWTLARQRGSTAVIRFTLPPCSEFIGESGGSTPRNQGHPVFIEYVMAEVWMVRRPCSGGDRPKDLEVEERLGDVPGFKVAFNLADPRSHGETGLLLGRENGIDKHVLRYFDGRSHTVETRIRLSYDDQPGRPG